LRDYLSQNGVLVTICSGYEDDPCPFYLEDRVSASWIQANMTDFCVVPSATRLCPIRGTTVTSSGIESWYQGRHFRVWRG